MANGMGDRPWPMTPYPWPRIADRAEQGGGLLRALQALRDQYQAVAPYETGRQEQAAPSGVGSQRRASPAPAPTTQQSTPVQQASSGTSWEILNPQPELPHSPLPGHPDYEAPPGQAAPGQAAPRGDYEGRILKKYFELLNQKSPTMEMPQMWV